MKKLAHFTTVKLSNQVVNRLNFSGTNNADFLAHYFGNKTTQTRVHKNCMSAKAKIADEQCSGPPFSSTDDKHRKLVDDFIQNGRKSLKSVVYHKPY
ncbi:hypothetical protein C0J52_19665 [Blattella germanica]|nr:hypothetical protein C0J52_19665 [Blattella germanica]